MIKVEKIDEETFKVVVKDAATTTHTVGLIAVDKNGKLSLRSTTGSMPRGAADSSGRFEVEIWFQR